MRGSLLLPPVPVVVVVVGGGRAAGDGAGAAGASGAGAAGAASTVAIAAGASAAAAGVREVAVGGTNIGWIRGAVAEEAASTSTAPAVATNFSGLSARAAGAAAAGAAAAPSAEPESAVVGMLMSRFSRSAMRRLWTVGSTVGLPAAALPVACVTAAASESCGLPSSMADSSSADSSLDARPSLLPEPWPLSRSSSPDGCRASPRRLSIASRHVADRRAAA